MMFMLLYRPKVHVHVWYKCIFNILFFMIGLLTIYLFVPSPLVSCLCVFSLRLILYVTDQDFHRNTLPTTSDIFWLFLILFLILFNVHSLHLSTPRICSYQLCHSSFYFFTQPTLIHSSPCSIYILSLYLRPHQFPIHHHHSSQKSHYY